jgi:hypothetical protein
MVNLGICVNKLGICVDKLGSCVEKLVCVARLEDMCG